MTSPIPYQFFLSSYLIQLQIMIIQITIIKKNSLKYKLSVFTISADTAICKWDFCQKSKNAPRRITDLKQLFYPPGDHYSLIRLLHYLCPITLLPYCQWHSYSIASASCSSLSECFVFRILHLLSVTQFKFVHLYAHTQLM